MRRLKKVLSTLCVMATVASLTGCGTSDDNGTTGSTEPVEGGTLTTMIQTEPDSLDTFISVAADTTSLLYNVYDGLMVLNDDGTMSPDLATGYTVSEDGLTYTFTIGDTAYFSNGEQVTMDDVLYSYQKYMTDSNSSAMFGNVESVSGEGDEVTFKLATADASFVSILNYGVAPNDPSIDLNETPIGSGPYMITDYTTGSEVIFEKNPYYNTNPDRVPHLDKIIVKVNMSDSSVSLNQFMAGDLDLCQFMDPATSATVEAQGDQVIAAPSNTVQIMAMNSEFAPFSDVKVRQAINFAIDKQAIVDTVMYGNGNALLSHMSPALSAYYTEDLENTYSLDLDKAKELLTEAGYADGFSFTIKVPSAYQRHVDTALMIKDMLAKIDVDVTVDQIEWATWLSDVYAGRQYEGTIIGIAGKPDPDTIMKIYTTTYDRNFYNYFNEDYDALIDQAKVETDAASRVELYQECQQILVDDAVCVYTMDPANVKFAKANVGGIKNYPAYFIDMASLYLTAQ